MKPLEVCTCQRAENLNKSSKIPKNNYAGTMVSAARRQIIGGGGPIHKIRRRRRRPQIVGGGAARPAHGSNLKKHFIALNLCCHVDDVFDIQSDGVSSLLFDLQELVKEAIRSEIGDHVERAGTRRHAN